MPDDFTIEIKGLSELLAAMEELPQKVAKRGLRKSLSAGGNVIAIAMYQNAPKHTGFLAEHFGTRIRIGRDGLSGTAFIGPQGKIDYPAYASGAYKVGRDAKGKAKQWGRIAVTTVARFLEFGTSKMFKKPFMTQAFEGHKRSALSAITEVLKEAVEQK